MSSAPGLYVHVPFCRAICPYCDFSVLTGVGRWGSRFLDGLDAELERWRGTDLGGPFDTIYVGGGTPTELGVEALARLLAAVRTHLPVAAGPDLTVEANPEDVDERLLGRLLELGVTTLSLGVQSFDDHVLATLGRQHDGAAAGRAVELTLAAGVPRLSVDLIYGVPGQTSDQVRSDLERVAELGPHHLSCYQLTIHEGTPFGFRRARGTLVEIGRSREADLFRLVHRVASAHGFAAYEVSNFARSPAHRSRHNEKYWRHVPYLGLGPSAHSFDGRRRWWNERKIKPWLDALAAGRRPVAGEERLDDHELALEALALGLRTAEGVDGAMIERRWGVDLIGANQSLLERLELEGLVTVEDRWIRPTLDGLAVADGLAVSFEV